MERGWGLEPILLCLYAWSGNLPNTTVYHELAELDDITGALSHNHTCNFKVQGRGV